MSKDLKVDFLSDFIILKNVLGNRILGTNGAISAFRSQAEMMSKYARVSINERGNEFDVYHSHSSMPFTYRIIHNALKHNKPVVVTAHQTHKDTDDSLSLPGFISETIKWYIAYYLNLADLIICPTETVKNIVREELHISDRPIKVISNGINTEEYKFSPNKRRSFRKEYNLNKSTVISVGMPINRKGYQNFSKIANHIPECNFLWAGEHFFSFLNSKYTQESSNIITPGYVEDINMVYSGGDIFCFPSFYEGEGLVILEAMCCGLPVIIRDLPVYEDRYIDGESCLKAESDKEFIDCIYYLLNNSDEKERIAKNGQKLVKNSFDIGTSVEKIYGIYEKLIALKS
jgi:1,2-diacylglycerol-3-alpha-glucose alpha-1,2-glucosyltransferase